MCVRVGGEYIVLTTTAEDSYFLSKNRTACKPATPFDWIFLSSSLKRPPVVPFTWLQHSPIQTPLPQKQLSWQAGSPFWSHLAVFSNVNSISSLAKRKKKKYKKRKKKNNSFTCLNIEVWKEASDSLWRDLKALMEVTCSYGNLCLDMCSSSPVLQLRALCPFNESSSDEHQNSPKSF